MGVKQLEFGDSLSGLLVDGIAGTPYVGATIRMTRDRGIVVEVPYLPDRGTGQFDHVQAWFDSQTPPTNMLLLTHEGPISLFDITWSGYSKVFGGIRTSVGSLRPTFTVLGHRDGELTDELHVTEMHSWLDGLNEWSGLSSVETDYKTDDQARVQSMTIKLEVKTNFSWKQGTATMSLRAGWLHTPEQNGYDRKTVIHDNVAIASSFVSEKASFQDHFAEHRKVAALMTFLFGRQLSFRKHSIRDDSFALRAGGKVYSTPLTEVIWSGTYRERTREVPSSKQLQNPIASLQQIGVEGLERWASCYEPWKRFILPSASVLGRKGAFIEEIITSTSMSMEAAGGLIGERLGEGATYTKGKKPKPTTATYVYRCLDALAVCWPEGLGDRVRLSRAIANSYNDVKHYDRGDFPEHDEGHVVSEINKMIVRLLAVYVAGRADCILEPYRKSDQFYQIRQLLDVYGLMIDENGKWSRTAAQA